MKKPDIAIIGAFGIDTNVYLYGNDIDFDVEANFSQNIDYLGQAGNYAARSANSLGLQVITIAALGNDTLGRWVETELQQDGIELIRILDPDGTKRSVNLMYKDGRRKNFYDGRGSMKIQPDPLSQQFDRIYLSRIAHVNIVNWSRFFLEPLKQKGIIISVDLQDVISPDDEYRSDYVKYADVLFFSTTNLKDIDTCIKYYQNVNPEIILVMGQGSNGTRLVTPDNDISIPAVVEGEPIIDTNGAGDSLAIGFLTSYYFSGYNLTESLFRGQLNARYTCSVKGSSHNLMDKEELEISFRKLRSRYI